MKSQPRTQAIRDWLQSATQQLTAHNIQTARLDAEIILAHTVHRSRTFLHAHGEDLIEPRLREIADARLALRGDRTPIAYIIGHREFYGRQFRVTPATLIPRPESETFIDLLNELLASSSGKPKKLVDVGTGSGILGITAKLEHPSLDVTLLDISRHALKVAETNAKLLDADVAIIHSDLLANYPPVADIIVANLPYVDPSWERSPETDHEPELALFAKDDGLQLINTLIAQARSHLTPGSYLLLEADPRQHTTIVDSASAHGFALREIRGFIVCLQTA